MKRKLFIACDSADAVNSFDGAFDSIATDRETVVQFVLVAIEHQVNSRWRRDDFLSATNVFYRRPIAAN